MKNIIITCDTEALEFPGQTDTVDRCIFGCGMSNHEGSAGIELMMECAEEFDARINFFYDVFTDHTHPGTNDRVCDSILRRGHGLCLHAHIEHLDAKWWELRGYIKPTFAANYFDRELADTVYKHAVDLFNRSAGFNPVAFRAGSWRYCAETLDALADLGVRYSYNYYPLTTIRGSFPHGTDAGILDVFRWSNGLIEVPTATVRGPSIRIRQKYVGFESHKFTTVRQYWDYVDAWERESPALQTMVMVMHSWSFLDQVDGKYTAYSEPKFTAFRDFLKQARGKYRFLQLDHGGSPMQDYCTDLVVPIQFSGVGGSRPTRLA